MTEQTQPKNPLVALWARGMGMRLLISCLSIAIGLPLGVGCVIVATMVGTSLADMQNGGTIFAVLAVGALCASVIIPIGIIAVIAMGRGRRFDPIFTPLGLQGKLWAVTWRKYEGQISSRETEIRVSRGPVLFLKMAGTLPTRGAIGTKTGLGQAVGSRLSTTIELDDPDMAHLAASSRTKDWMKSLLGDSDARAAILRLTRDAFSTDVRTVSIEPAGLRLTVSYIPISEITTNHVQAWLDDMATVLKVAEGLPPPVAEDMV